MNGSLANDYTNKSAIHKSQKKILIKGGFTQSVVSQIQALTAS